MSSELTAATDKANFPAFLAYLNEAEQANAYLRGLAHLAQTRLSVMKHAFIHLMSHAVAAAIVFHDELCSETFC